MIEFLQVSLATSLAVLTAAALLIAYAIYQHAPRLVERVTERIENKLFAEAVVLQAQARHVDQTREVEYNTLEATIKAHEKNGANKLRSELARITDAAELESRLGFKLDKTHISKAEHELQLAKSRAIIETLEKAGQLSDTRTVFNGQPSPGASIPV